MMPSLSEVAEERPHEAAQNGEKVDEGYYQMVAQRMQQTRGWRPEMDKLGAGRLSDHVAGVLLAHGGLNPVNRLAEVEHAVRRQHELQAEKRLRKKERMRDAVRGANNKHEAREPGSVNAPSEDRPKMLGHRGSDLANAVKDLIDESWAEVSSFKSKEEAVGFVMECQPFSFAPVLDRGSEPLPKFETNHEAVEYVLKMDPVPLHFVSTVNDFKRRLRIRFVEVTEEDSTRKAASSRSKRRVSAVAATMERAAAGAAQKPWLVEAAGSFFESPSSLRSVREAGTKYFIAVAQDLVQTVQQEGYRVQNRCSIPLSASPQEALAAWTRYKKDPTTGRVHTKAVVLPVVIPPEMDVVTHRNSGFLVRTKELPPSCFRVKKAGGPAGATSTDAKGDAS